MSPVAWWKQNTARNTFIFANFLICFPGTLFNTYAVYQLQTIGFLIGTDINGEPCTTYCLVPFAGSRLDLNSVLLYMNAMTFGFGGFIMIFLTAYADFWSKKTLLVTLSIMTYGALSIPAYWLKDYTLSAFNSLLALWIVFNVVTFILGALLNIYIPYCMRQSAMTALSEPQPVVARAQSETRNEEKQPSYINTSVAETEAETPNRLKSAARKYGFAMSILGTLGNAFGACLMLGITIILARYLSANAGQSAGLLVTTIMGSVTVLLGVPVYFGLPSLPTKPWPANGGWRSALMELATPYREMFLRKRNMMFLLLAYTIYSDTLFALYSLTSQLYFIEVQPDTFEYSLYTLSGNLFWALLTAVFYVAQLHFKWDLGKVLIIGYALILIIPIWGCIGLANIENFGLKKRWEFYVQVLIFYGSQAIVNPTFRLLYAELVPAGEEIMWFGLQVILSCATTWVNYVATAPLQNHTHNLRFPIVLCLVMLIMPLVLEYLRGTMRMFKRESDVITAGTMRDVDDSRGASESA